MLLEGGAGFVAEARPVELEVDVDEGTAFAQVFGGRKVAARDSVVADAADVGAGIDRGRGSAVRPAVRAPSPRRGQW